MEKQGYIQVYTGEGKGKTTAAIGLCIRAIGHQKCVAMIQFLKNGRSGECEVLKSLGVIMSNQTAPNRPPWDQSAQSEWFDYSKIQWEQVNDFLLEDFDVIILDELLGIINKGFIQKEEVLSFLEKKPEKTEIIITGRSIPEWLMQKADLITNMQEVKHYFRVGVPAREGIEY